MKRGDFCGGVNVVVKRGGDVEIGVMGYREKELVMVGGDVREMDEVEGGGGKFFGKVRHELGRGLRVLEG